MDSIPGTQGDDMVDVSVLVMSYYHERYIAQAMDSILSQKTDLRYEVLVGDDASGDRTPDILRDYAVRYPDRVRLFLRTENLGGTRNNWELFRHSRGKYAAILEGDDYWLDPDKLQLQFDFLEAHPDFSGCCGKCLVVDGNGVPDETRQPKFVQYQETFTLEDHLSGWQLPGQAGTWMFRNYFRGGDPERYSILYRAHRNVGDKTLMLLLLSHGPFHGFDRTLSAYRQVNQTGGHNHFSLHYANPYRDYDMFLYPCRLEAWARKNLGVRTELGPRKAYRYQRFLRAFLKEPDWKRFRYLVEMTLKSRHALKYCRLAVQTLMETE